MYYMYPHLGLVNASSISASIIPNSLFLIECRGGGLSPADRVFYMHDEKAVARFLFWSLLAIPIVEMYIPFLCKKN